MDKCMSSRDIYEQYADAATALVMDQYALAMQESIAASKDDDTDVSENLDSRCLKTIRKKLAKEQRKHTAIILLRVTKTAVMLVLMLFGVMGILFTTVEAVRIPIINFFIEQKDGYIEITGDSYNRSAEKATGEDGEIDIDDPLKDLLPEDYVRVTKEMSDSGSSAILYENQLGQYVHLYTDPYYGSLHVDTEDAVSIEEIQIDSYEAVLTQKNGYQIVWLNTDSNIIYHIDANALGREELIILAENIENFR